VTNVRIEGLLKSSAITTTNWCVVSSWVMVCRIEVNAPVVEPVGRKANWSLKFRVDGDGALVKVG